MSGETNQVDWRAILAAFGQMPEVRDIWFNKKEVKLDGYRFVGCRFDGCALKVSSANFELEGCLIDETTTIYYSGDTIKPIRLFTARYPWFYENLPFFAPTKNADGTITIKG